jgi:hypothetical protein
MVDKFYGELDGDRADTSGSAHKSVEPLTQEKMGTVVVDWNENDIPLS